MEKGISFWGRSPCLYASDISLSISLLLFFLSGSFSYSPFDILGKRVTLSLGMLPLSKISLGILPLYSLF
jgi:hypothetical protein